MKINRALISVSDKTGVVPFARRLREMREGEIPGAAGNFASSCGRDGNLPLAYFATWTYATARTPDVI